MATYSEVPDLLVGDLLLSSKVDPQRFVSDATDEINSQLGRVYTLPLGSLPTYQALLLKRCANLIASGRLMLAMASGTEDTSVNAYGEMLLREGKSILQGIVNGTIKLDSPLAPSDGPNNLPVIESADSVSGVEAFYGFIQRDPRYSGHPPYQPYG